jgi:hypothetical protein
MPSLPMGLPADKGRNRAARFKVGDSVMTNHKAPGQFRGRRGQITAMIQTETECRVAFEDGMEPAVGHLRLVWLEL